MPTWQRCWQWLGDDGRGAADSGRASETAVHYLWAVAGYAS